MKWRELAGRKLEIQYRPPFPGFEHLQGSFYCRNYLMRQDRRGQGEDGL